MKAITQAISCFLCCLLTMLTLCSCQTEAANNNDNQEDKKLLGDADGDIEPLIVVSATFYHENSSTDFGSSEDALRAFHNDFEKHLMPAVEGQFHTYAKSTSDEDLKASRDHRAFGGFSLGSVTTWLQFCYDYDYIATSCR